MIQNEWVIFVPEIQISLFENQFCNSLYQNNVVGKCIISVVIIKEFEKSTPIKKNLSAI